MRLLVLGLLASVVGCGGTQVTIDLGEWDCTKRESRLVYLPISAGKAVVLQPHYINQCVRYER